MHADNFKEDSSHADVGGEVAVIYSKQNTSVSA